MSWGQVGGYPAMAPCSRKYITPSKGQKVNPNTNTEMGHDPEPQLYDLSVDLGETKNLAAQHPAKVKELARKLEEIRAAK